MAWAILANLFYNEEVGLLPVKLSGIEERMSYGKTNDIFITHAWRYHGEWTEMSRLMETALGRSWRNFSVPWHDPAMDANTETGGNFIRNWLETQIMPVHGVILLSGVYKVKSTQKWLGMEVEFARKHQKPIIVVPPYEDEGISDDVLAMADAVCQWDAGEIISKFNELNMNAASR